MKKTTETDRVTHPVKISQIKSNDLMTFVYYVKVSSSNPDKLKVVDVDSGIDFSVNGKDLIERSFSADQFEETIKVTKTKAAEILVSAYNRPFTVCFEKQDGDERVLRGRLIQPEPLLGRSMVEDLDTKDDHKLRQVDHRTIKYLILEGVKYAVK